MSAEPFIAFFIVQQLRKTVKTATGLQYLSDLLKYALYVIVGLFIVTVIFERFAVFNWMWHVVVLGLLWLIYTKEIFQRLRPVMFAVLPVIVISIVEDVTKLSDNSFFKTIHSYTELTFPFAIIWLVTMLIIFNKQQKALEKERKKRLEEEEHNKIISVRKAELEEMVSERTAELQRQKEELQHALNELTETQNQLVHAAKMASLGELTAGIAHEIQNPLNFVNNFSEVNIELIEELKSHQASVNGERDEQLQAELLTDLTQNLQKILYHGKRADAIVKGMLQHSRTTTGIKEPTDINALIDEYLRLSFHGMRAKDKTFKATMHTSYDENIGKINVIPQDIGRVLLNLFNNAFYAITEKRKTAGENYEPAITVTTKRKDNGEIVISIKDNGTGIPENLMNKVFQPFFTTKPTGQGTGLGLSLSYDVIKAHGGDIRIDTKEGEYTNFIIEL